MWTALVIAIILGLPLLYLFLFSVYHHRIERRVLLNASVQFAGFRSVPYHQDTLTAMIRFQDSPDDYLQMMKRDADFVAYVEETEPNNIQRLRKFWHVYRYVFIFLNVSVLITVGYGIYLLVKFFDA